MNPQLKSHARLRRTLLGGLLAGVLVASAACGVASSSGAGSGSGGGSGGTSKGSLSIASQNFPEAALMADMYQQLLEKDGYSVTVKLVGTRDVYMAKGQFPGAIQVVPEYLGAFGDYLNTLKSGANAKAVSTASVSHTLAASQALANAKGITLLTPAKATDADAFFVTQKFATAHHLTDLSSLGASGLSVTLAAAPDCQGRVDCAGGLEQSYGIKITKILSLGFASDQTYQSVIKGESQLGETSTTDGSLPSQGLKLLTDNKGIQPAENLIPAVSTTFLKAHPDVKTTLDKLMAVLTTADLIKMNGEMGNQRMKPQDVAKAYLTSKGLL